MSANDYEKIVLSKQDLKFVYTQILNKITSKLDLHLPMSDSDPLKNKVASALHEFLIGGFELAKSALIVDGNEDFLEDKSLLSISDILSLKPKETVEPFDLKINSNLREIVLNVEKETVNLTKLRRDLPLKTNEIYELVFMKIKEDVNKVIADIDSECNEIYDSLPSHNNIPNLNLIIQDYDLYLSCIDELMKTIPNQIAEVDRLNDSLLFIEKAYEKQNSEISQFPLIFN